MNTLLKTLVALAIWVVGASGVANAASVLVVSSEPAMVDRLTRSVQPLLEPIPNKITFDRQEKSLKTDEGTKVDIASLTTQTFNADLKAVKALELEYEPDFLLIGWVQREERLEYASYGLELLEMVIQVRLVDMKTGKTVFNKQLSHGTDFASKESDDSLRDDVLTNALGKFNDEALASAYESFVSDAQGIQNRLRISVMDLNQEIYFALRSTILTAVSRAGIEGEARISYSNDFNEATVRIVTAKKVTDYYRELYASLSAVQSIDGFELERQGISINLLLKPQSPRIISVRTLSPADYGSVGRSMVSFISGAEGVSNVTQAYSEVDQTLTVSFLLTGTSIYSVDGAIWAGVSGDDRFKDLAMGKLDEKEIEYFFSGRENAPLSDIFVTLKNVAPSDYKELATLFADLLGKTKGVRNLRYRYDFENETVVYRLNFEGANLQVLDDAILRRLLTEEKFAFVSKGAETIGNLSYVFNQSAEEVEARVAKAKEDKGAANSEAGSDLSVLDDSVVFIENVDEDGTVSTGTGFFVSESGYVLTNAHVVDKPYVLVTTFNGYQYRAEKIKSDPELDLALLRVVTNVDRFTPAKVGNSDSVRRGQPVTVIGNPGWGAGEVFDHSVLKGIVSGINRSSGALQLSITTYGGVSGAPVFSDAGEVIGVMVAVPMGLANTVVLAGNQAAEVTQVQQMNEFGLAIPINFARSLIAIAR